MKPLEYCNLHRRIKPLKREKAQLLDAESTEVVTSVRTNGVRTRRAQLRIVRIKLSQATPIRCQGTVSWLAMKRRKKH